MKSYKMIDIDIPNNHAVKITKDTWIRANSSGLFHMNKLNGSYVSKDDLLGVICNPFGNIEHKVLSPADGYIVGINNQPVVNQGDALIHLGLEE
jgi:predicted deacylase